MRTNPTANVRLRFSGLARSISFLTEAEDVSLGNNRVIKVFFSGADISEDTATAGVYSGVVDVEVDNVSFGVEGTGSEGFKVDSP